MSNITLFGGKAKLPQMPKGFEDDFSKNIAGSGGGGRRISIKGGKFRQVVGGEEIFVSKDDVLNVVIINAAPISRTYYEGAYKANETSAPTCWSSNTQTPDPSVPEDQRQASKCADCPMNIKGSGQGDSRACRFNQRVAVVLDGEIENREVYQLSLPATSVFGDPKNDKMPLQAYGKFLSANGVHIMSVVTQMQFDEKAEVSKLFFSAVRPLTQEELDVCIELKDSEEAKRAITLTVGDTDAGGAGKALPSKKAAVEEEDDDSDEEPPKKAATKKPAKKKPEPEQEDDEDDDIPEPEVPKKKKKAEPEPEDDDDGIDDLLDGWDD